MILVVFYPYSKINDDEINCITWSLLSPMHNRSRLMGSFKCKITYIYRCSLICTIIPFCSELFSCLTYQLPSYNASQQPSCLKKTQKFSFSLFC